MYLKDIIRGEKEMKKRILSVILTLGMTLGLLCGCGQNGGSQTDQTETQTAQEQNYEPVVYDYEQDLNVIDDNYRNYYEIFVYSFYDSDGDGIGDFNGVIDKLDYIHTNRCYYNRSHYIISFRITADIYLYRDAITGE